jgi:ankyrin repeat protein
MNKAAVELLLEHNARPDDASSKHPRPLEWLLDKFTFRHLSEYSRPAENDRLDMIKLLIKHGADIAKPNYYKKSMIEIARENHFWEIVKYFEEDLNPSRARQQAHR